MSSKITIRPVEPQNSRQSEVETLRQQLHDLGVKWTQAMIDLDDLRNNCKRQQIIISYLENKFLP